MSAIPAIVFPIIAAAVLAQWLVFAAIGVLSRRPADQRLTKSSIVLALGWLFVFGMPLAPRTKAVQASAAVTSTEHGSCATVDQGMTADQVAKNVGPPDEKRPNDDARGPGAVIWIYRDSRCAVHLFDGKVEAVD